MSNNKKKKKSMGHNYSTFKSNVTRPKDWNELMMRQPFILDLIGAIRCINSLPKELHWKLTRVVTAGVISWFYQVE